MYCFVLSVEPAKRVKAGGPTNTANWLTLSEHAQKEETLKQFSKVNSQHS